MGKVLLYDLLQNHCFVLFEPLHFLLYWRFCHNHLFLLFPAGIRVDDVVVWQQLQVVPVFYLLLELFPFGVW